MTEKNEQSGTPLIDRLSPIQGHKPRKWPTVGLRGSAVLVPILEQPQPRLLYTMRAAHLKHHPSQFSFPGGRIEPGETPWHAALREAFEEIGLPASRVHKVGRIDDFFSPKGFHIQCFVARVEPFEPVINHDEVERIVTVNLDEIFERQRHEVKMWRSIKKLHYFHFDEGTVWGVTGQITYQLREILEPE
jgi:8-oxo-dGTP pyrophosphatase MutT (NUDIX family)